MSAGIRICADGHHTKPMNREQKTCLVCDKPSLSVDEAIAAARDEGAVPGFADCEGLTIAMARSMADDLESGKLSVPGHAGDALAGKIASWALNSFALALTTGQHRTDAYDPEQLATAHRKAAWPSQVSKMNKARALALSPERKREIALNASKAASTARRARAKGE